MRKRTRLDPSQIGWPIGRRRRTPRRPAVVPLGPHLRRHRPPRLRQDPRPAHPGTARRPRRRSGHPHQDRRPAAHHHRPQHRRTALRRARPVRPGRRAPRTRLGPDRRLRRPASPPNARAKAFTDGTIRNATSGGSGDAAARFYAAEAAKVLACYLHAAALVGHRPRPRPALGRQPPRHRRTRRHPARTPPRRTPLARPAPRRRSKATTAPPPTPSPPSSKSMELFFQPAIRRPLRPRPTAGPPPTSPRVIRDRRHLLPPRPRRPLRLAPHR